MRCRLRGNYIKQTALTSSALFVYCLLWTRTFLWNRWFYWLTRRTLSVFYLKAKKFPGLIRCLVSLMRSNVKTFKIYQIIQSWNSLSRDSRISSEIFGITTEWSQKYKLRIRRTSGSLREEQFLWKGPNSYDRFSYHFAPNCVSVYQRHSNF